MKRIIMAVLTLALLLAGCGADSNTNTPTAAKVKELSVGDTFEVNGIRFTLNDFCFAKKVDYETYDPNMIDGSSYSPNNGYIWGYLNYTVKNNGTNTLSHFLGLDVYLIYGDGYSYGTTPADYKVACTDDDKYNLDVDPLMQKTYHHIITNCPESISKPTMNIKIVVKIDGVECNYVISPSEVTVNEGQEAPKPEISFTPASASTDAYIRNRLNGVSYEWYNGNIKCTLKFKRDSVTLVQRIAGQNFTVNGTYEVGTDKIKANYGQGDVYYAWSDSGNKYLDLTVLQN